MRVKYKGISRLFFLSWSNRIYPLARHTIKENKTIEIEQMQEKVEGCLICWFEYDDERRKERKEKREEKRKKKCTQYIIKTRKEKKRKRTYDDEYKVYYAYSIIEKNKKNGSNGENLTYYYYFRMKNRNQILIIVLLICNKQWEWTIDESMFTTRISQNECEMSDKKHQGNVYLFVYHFYL